MIYKNKHENMKTKPMNLSVAMVTILMLELLTSCKNYVSHTQEFLGMSPKYFVVSFVWAMFGVIVNVLSDIVRRKKSSSGSPKKLSIAYWWSDNQYRVLLSIMLVPIVIVGFQQLFGLELSRLYAFMIGYFSDHISEIMKRKNIFAQGKQ
jgi:hypothetical protein